MTHAQDAQGWWQKLVARCHPEGIPWPASLIYDAFSRSRLFQRHYQLLAADLGCHLQEGVVLDIGTGPAWFPIILCRSLPAIRVTGVDISSGMVERAIANVRKTGLADRISIRQAAAAELPFPDESFDAVVSTGSLHHWREPVKCLNEVHRVLKPGRKALMYDLVRRVPPEIVAQMRREYGSFRLALLGLHSFEEPFYSPQQMQALAAESRFGHGETRFVGALCCLEMSKAGGP